MNSDLDRHGGERMICPRCGIEQPKAVECANCGVVVKKWKPTSARGPRLKQAGIGAILVFFALLIVFVAVLLKADFGNPTGRIEVSSGGGSGTTPVAAGPVGTTATQDVMTDFWSSGVVGLRAASEDQRDRKVAILVWFYREDCAECKAVQDQIFDNEEVDAWLAQNNRVRIDPSSTPDNQDITDKFGVTRIPTAFIIRSDGVRKPVEVFAPGTTTPRAPADWLKDARAIAVR